MDIISGMLTSDPNKRLTVDECLHHAWIKGDVLETQIANKSSLRILNSFPKKQSNMNRLFLVNEDPINLDCFESESDSEINEMDYINIGAPLNGIIKKGYMKKEGKVFKSWKKRWFILQNNGMVSYYYSQKDLRKAIGEFSILNYTQLIVSTKHEYGFILCTVQRNWKFIASNKQQRNEWMRAFEQCHRNNIKIKNQKQTLQINKQKFKKLRQSFDRTRNNMISISQLTRSDSVNRKISNQIDKKMEQMITDLNIPQQRRHEMLDLEQTQKLQLIEQYTVQSLYNKTPKHVSYTKVNNCILNENESKENELKLLFSLATESLAIKRKRICEQNSFFGAKHDKIMSSLVDAVQLRLHVIENDKEVMQYVEQAFYNEKHKYICRSVDNISFETCLQCIEFMLKELWDNEHTQQLYEKLVKKISLTYKAKIFSIGADRRDRMYMFKKYMNCFIGSEGIDWLINAKFVKDFDDKRERAMDLGNSFRTKGFMKHVCGEHKFKDEKLFYQLNDALIEKHCLMEQSNAMKNTCTNNDENECKNSIYSIGDVCDNVSQNIEIETLQNQREDVNDKNEINNETIQHNIMQLLKDKIKQNNNNNRLGESVDINDLITVFAGGNGENNKSSQKNTNNSGNHRKQNSNTNRGNYNENNNDNNNYNYNNNNDSNSNSNGGSGGDDDDDDKNNDEKKSDNNTKQNSKQLDEQMEKEIERFFEFLNNIKDIHDKDIPILLSTFSASILCKVKDGINELNKEIQRLSYHSNVLCIETDQQKSKNINIKTKTKTRKSVCSPINYTPSITKSIYYIPRQFTEKVIPLKIFERINIEKGAVFDFIIKSLAINRKNNLRYNNTLSVFNFGVHDRQTKEILYFVAKHQDINVLKHRGSEWLMDELCTKHEIISKYNICPTKLPSAITFNNDLNNMKHVQRIIMQSKKKIINKTKWSKVPIYNKINHKRRITLSLTNEEFMTSFKRFSHNMEEIQLIPIVMFDENGKYYVEYIWIINIESNVSIGISFRLNKTNDGVSVVGIHLNRNCIFKQHIVISVAHQCHHLEHFTSHITDLHIGNPDDNINKIKRLENQVTTLKQQNCDLKGKLISNYGRSPTHSRGSICSNMRPLSLDIENELFMHSVHSDVSSNTSMSPHSDISVTMT